jgi:hypothetical protein
VWVPFSAGTGNARLILSYPSLSQRQVVPVTVELPLGEVGWQGWLRTAGGWALLALVAGLVVLLARRLVRRGRRPAAQGAATPG